VTVLKPSVSSCIVETLGEGTAEAVSKVNPHSAYSFECETIYEDPGVITAA
jgi:hypothetical protein